MREYAVTGIRHQMGDEQTPKAEKEAIAIRLVQGIAKGTPVTLKAEPDNPKDENAIAVYMEWDDAVRRVGYIKSSECLELKPLLDEEQMADGEVTRGDGHVTFFIVVANAPDGVRPQTVVKRQLPDSPINKTIMLPTTEQEGVLQVMIRKIDKMGQPAANNVAQMIHLLGMYVPLAAHSICYEDAVWRDEMHRKADEICDKMKSLGLTDDECKEIGELRETLRDIDADFTRNENQSFLAEVMNRQMASLRLSAEKEDGFFAKYDKAYLKGDLEKADKKIVEQELGRLKSWITELPWLELRDYKNQEPFATKLKYLRLSRRELYDVYSVLLLIGRLEERLSGKRPDEKPELNYFAPQKNIQVLLAEKCEPLHSDKYDADWLNSMVEGLMSSEHGEHIAREWTDEDKRETVKACIIGEGGVKNVTNNFYGNQSIPDPTEVISTKQDEIDDGFNDNEITRKLESLQDNPPSKLLDSYYEQQQERFDSEISEAKSKAQAVLHEAIQEKRKVNKLREMKDVIIDQLCKSEFLTELKKDFTHYDLDDYRRENNCPDMDDDIVRVELTLADLLTDGGTLNKQKIARHIFFHRKEFSRDCIATFYIYAELVPELDRLIGALHGNEKQLELPTKAVAPTIEETLQDLAVSMKKAVERPTEVHHYHDNSKHIDHSRKLTLSGGQQPEGQNLLEDI